MSVVRCGLRLGTTSDIADASSLVSVTCFSEDLSSQSCPVTEHPTGWCAGHDGTLTAIAAVPEITCGMQQAAGREGQDTVCCVPRPML